MSIQSSINQVLTVGTWALQKKQAAEASAAAEAKREQDKAQAKEERAAEIKQGQEFKLDRDKKQHEYKMEEIAARKAQKKPTSVNTSEKDKPEDIPASQPSNENTDYMLGMTFGKGGATQIGNEYMSLANQAAGKRQSAISMVKSNVKTLTGERGGWTPEKISKAQRGEW